MRICNCALPSLRGNTDCCKYCNNYDDSSSFQTSIPWMPKITKKEIIERFDDKGNLIERITKEI